VGREWRSEEGGDIGAYAEGGVRVSRHRSRGSSARDIGAKGGVRVSIFISTKTMTCRFMCCCCTNRLGTAYHDLQLPNCNKT